MSVATIGKALAQDDPEERRRATASLRDVPPDDGIALVLRALGDEDWRVRKEAIAVAVAYARQCEMVISTSSMPIISATRAAPPLSSTIGWPVLRWPI